MWTTANSMSARALVAVARTTTSHSGFNSNYYYYGAGCGVVGVRTVGGMAAQVSAPTIPPAKSASPTNHPSAYGRDPEDFRRMNRTREESLYKLGKHRSNAMELVHMIPVVEVDGHMAVCDGGGGALGHPVEYISLDRPDSVAYCKYCALRYTQKKKV